jgi:hypothetical protein
MLRSLTVLHIEVDMRLRVIVCTDALRKPKPRRLSWLITRSSTVRASYLAAQRACALRIVEEW